MKKAISGLIFFLWAIMTIVLSVSLIGMLVLKRESWQSLPETWIEALLKKQR